jgi:hypothetical protein
MSNSDDMQQSKVRALPATGSNRSIDRQYLPDREPVAIPSYFEESYETRQKRWPTVDIERE